MYELEFLPEDYVQRLRRRQRFARRAWVSLASACFIGLCAISRSFSPRPTLAPKGVSLASLHSRTQIADAKSLPTQADQKEQRLTPAEILRQQAGQLQAEAFRLQL